MKAQTKTLVTSVTCRASFAVAIAVLGLAVGLQHPKTASAQACNSDPGCQFLTCSRPQDPWQGEFAIWNRVIALPIHVQTTRSIQGGTLIWKPYVGLNQFPPLQYTACWGPYGQECETVKVDSNGNDTNPIEHPNIRFNNGQVLCDGATATKRKDMDGSCVKSVTYGFDVREMHPTFGCFEQAYVYQQNPSPGLQARNLGQCESPANPFGWIPTPVHAVSCGTVVEGYRYLLGQ